MDSIEAHLASPPPSAPPSPSPQPQSAALLRSMSMSTPGPAQSPTRTVGRVARSRSVSVRGSLASGLTSGQLTPPENAWDRDWDTIGRGRQQGRQRGEGGLWWDAEMGICWDGNEIREWQSPSSIHLLDCADISFDVIQSNPTSTPSLECTTPTPISSTLHKHSSPRQPPPYSTATRLNSSSPPACPPSHLVRHSSLSYHHLQPHLSLRLRRSPRWG